MPPSTPRPSCPPTRARRPRRLQIATLAVLLTSCASWRSRGPAAATAELATVATDPEAYGQRVYRGDVYALGEASDEPLFRYERRVTRSGASQRSTSFTRRGDEVVLVETAEHGPGPELRSYHQWQRQTGEVGEVTVSEREVCLRFADADGERSACEARGGPVVVGPTLFLFLEAHRARLAAGEAIALRFAVPSRLETVGFILEQASANGDEVRFRMRPSAPLIALAVAPLLVVYRRGSLARLEGRVPTRRRLGERWVDLDARVDYADVLTPYQ